LRKIAVGPVAGYTFYAQGTSTIVRYQDKSTGYIYDVNGNSTVAQNISSSLLLRTYTSQFADKDSLILSTVSTDLSEIRSLVGNITSSSSLSMSFIEENMIGFTTSPDGVKAFYIIKTPSGSDWYTYDFTRKRKNKVYSSPLSEWRVMWPSKDTVYLFGKPSSTAETGLYSFDVDTSQLKPILLGTGLVANMNAEGKGFISTYTRAGILSEFIDTKSVVRTPVFTPALADKCAWYGTKNLFCGTTGVLKGNLPDLWYMGDVDFSDQLVSFNPATGISTPISLLGNGEVGEEIDVYRPMVSDNGQYIMFVNKHNGSLWLLDRNNTNIGQ